MCLRSLGLFGFVGAGEVGFGEGLGGWDLGVDGTSLVVEFGVVGESGDEVVVGA